MKIAPQFVTDPSTASSLPDQTAVFLLLIAVTLIFYLALVPLLLQFAVKWVTKFKPSFKEAFFINLKIMGISFVGSFVLGLVVGFAIGLSGGSEETANAVSALLVIAFFPFQAWLYGRLVKVPESGPIGIGRGALVMIAQILITLAFMLGLAILVFVAGFVSRLVGN